MPVRKGVDTRLSLVGWFWGQVIDDFIISGIGFILGLLFRKRVGHWLVEVKKYIGNDILTTDFVAVRLYPPLELPPLDSSVFERANVKFRNLRSVEVFDDEMIVSAPIFGRLRLRVDRLPSIEDEVAEVVPTSAPRVERVKLTLRNESPLRLGVRESKKLDDLVNIANALFDGVELLAATKGSRPTEDYVVMEVNRITHFLPEKTFDIDDKELSARVRGTPTKIAITSPSMKLVEATKKYRFA
jgi:hypothetical protein